MAFKRPRARILERTITAGNGPYAMSAVDAGWNRFSSYMSVNDTTLISVVEPGVAFWMGIGTYSAANQITLTTVEEFKGTFGAGTKEIMACAMASQSAIPGDIAGAIVTGGTSTAYTVSSFAAYDSLARMNGNMIAFTPHTTNGATVTLNVDGLGAKPLRPSPGVELQSNVLISGTPYMATYNNSDAVFYLHGLGGNAYGVPLGAGMDFWGATAPSSAFAFPTGQQLSQTTYAALYAVFGPNRYGADGGGLFYMPDKTGRVSAMKEAAATRLTTAGGGVDGATIGSANTGNNQSVALGTPNLPAYTPQGTITNGAITNGAITINGEETGRQVSADSNQASNPGGDYSSLSAAPLTVTASQGTTTQATSTFAGTAQGGTSTAFKIVQPTIVCNYIIRVL